MRCALAIHSPLEEMLPLFCLGKKLLIIVQEQDSHTHTLSPPQPLAPDHMDPAGATFMSTKPLMCWNLLQEKSTWSCMAPALRGVNSKKILDFSPGASAATLKGERESHTDMQGRSPGVTSQRPAGVTSSTGPRLNSLHLQLAWLLRGVAWVGRLLAFPLPGRRVGQPSSSHLLVAPPPAKLT